MSNYKYALIIDSGTQWFTYVVKYQYKNSIEPLYVVESYLLPTEVDEPYINNICSRDVSIYGVFTNNIPNRDHYHGIPLSAYEYNRVVKIIKLSKFVKEYKRLGKLE